MKPYQLKKIKLNILFVAVGILAFVSSFIVVGVNLKKTKNSQQKIEEGQHTLAILNGLLSQKKSIQQN